MEAPLLSGADRMVYMKRRKNPADLMLAIHDLAKAAKPSARHLTGKQVDKIIHEVRREAREKSNGRGARRP